MSISAPGASATIARARPKPCPARTMAPNAFSRSRGSLKASVANGPIRRRLAKRSAAAMASWSACSRAAALRFAKRRRLGPFAAAMVGDPKEREKALGAMVRAGHGFGLARAVIALPPGADIDIEELSESAR